MLDQTKYGCDKSKAGYVYVPQSGELLSALNAVNYNQTLRSPDCDCFEKMQQCPVGAGGPLPSFDVLETKDVMYRLAGYNLTDW